MSDHERIRNELQRVLRPQDLAAFAEIVREFRCVDPERDWICDLQEAVLGICPHGVDLDREFCPEGCRV